MPDDFETAFPESLKKGLFFRTSGIPIGRTRIFATQKEIAFQEFLKENVLHYENNHINTTKLIKVIAEKFGGAHYDSKAPRHIHELSHVFKFNSQNQLDVLILQIADLCADFGIHLLRKISDFELFLLIRTGEVSSTIIAFLNMCFLEP